MCNFCGKKIQVYTRRLLLAVILLLMVVTWVVDGLPILLRISGGCMAPELSGAHREIVCRDCSFSYSCDARIYDTFPNAVCPNCGGMRTPLAAFPVLPGDGVLVHRSTFRMRPPRRWEPVAFRLPDDSTKIGIKRIVGLPGETIEIKEGEIYIDGTQCRKKLADQKRLAILVHDANYRALHDGKPVRCWLPDTEHSKWTEDAGRFSCKSSPENKTVDWLSFHNLRFDPNRPDRIVETPIQNRYAYNQGLPRRSEEIHEVADLIFSFQICELPSITGNLSIRTTVNGIPRQIDVDLKSQKWFLKEGNHSIASGKIPKDLKITKGSEILVSTVDQQLLFAVNDMTIISRDFNQATVPIRSEVPILSLGRQGSDICIKNLKVYRDVHFSDDILALLQLEPQETYRTGTNEYFVLGTNCPISDDSRFWNAGPALPERFLVGRPFAVHFPAKQVELGKLLFQVPAAGKIRYIR